MFLLCLSTVLLVSATYASRLEKVGTSYTVGEANRMCEFALASYCCGNLGHGVRDWSCEACKLQPQMINITVCDTDFDKDANGFVAYDPNAPAIVVAFAGTDPLSLENWINDIDDIKEDYPACSGCKVHKGFYDTYKAIEDQIFGAVEGLWNAYGRNTNVQVTGHSLGAALAAYCALDIYDKSQVVPQIVYTYGQPRAGNQQFEEYYQSKVKNHFRVTHHKDPVPHLPSESDGFHHMPLEIFYIKNPNGTYDICDGSGEDPHCSDQYALDLDLDDHLTYMGFSFVDNYLSCKL